MGSCFSSSLSFGASPDAVFSTAITSLKPEDAFDPNRVKCVVDKRGYAIYFSRGLIPYNKSGRVNPQFSYLLHLGIQVLKYCMFRKPFT
ncbi:hypothetical protein L1049_027512 [Liquidambar formosana]|uniref:Uncharacterized protein n=1 Tax=Liquidambar formosana TaxID=63359 RepID=A0AAP0RJ83_LIQFO